MELGTKNLIRKFSLENKINFVIKSIVNTKERRQGKCNKRSANKRLQQKIRNISKLLIEVRLIVSLVTVSGSGDACPK